MKRYVLFLALIFSPLLLGAASSSGPSVPYAGTPLHEAILNRDADLVQACLYDGLFARWLSERDSNSRTPLELASAVMPEFVPFLVSAPSENQHDEAWSLADVDDQTLDPGSDVACYKNLFDSACTYIYAGNVKMLQHVLKETPALVDIGDEKEGYTLLHHAVEAENVEMIKILRLSGAPVDAIMRQEIGSARDLAGKKGFINEELVCALDIPHEKLVEAWQRAARQKKSPSRLRAQHSERNALTSSRPSFDLAGLASKAEVKGSILREGENPILAFRNALDMDDGSALMPLLLSNVFDPNARDENGLTPLHVTAIHGKIKGVAGILVDRGARMSDVCPEGKTVVHMLAAKGNAAVLQALVERDFESFSAIINLPDRNGKTPFDYAANDEVRELLSTFGGFCSVGFELHSSSDAQRDQVDILAECLQDLSLQGDSNSGSSCSGRFSSCSSSSGPAPQENVRGTFLPDDVEQLWHNNSLSQALPSSCSSSGSSYRGTALHQAIREQNCSHVQMCLEELPDSKIGEADSNGKTAWQLIQEVADPSIQQAMSLMFEDRSSWLMSGVRFEGSDDSSSHSDSYDEDELEGPTFEDFKKVLMSDDGMWVTDLDLQIVKYRGPDVRVICDEHGSSLMHFVLARPLAPNIPQTLDVIKILSEYVTPWDVIDNQKRTPLHIAALNNDADAISFLLKNRIVIDVHACDVNGKKAIDLVAPEHRSLFEAQEGE
ncbi:hypothetical protein K2X40_00135 [Candidatus Babeliales bacterium]|nr:hypothetical protein [Candidatus Babeliales bacterium]